MTNVLGISVFSLGPANGEDASRLGDLLVSVNNHPDLSQFERASLVDPNYASSVTLNHQQDLIAYSSTYKTVDGSNYPVTVFLVLTTNYKGKFTLDIVIQSIVSARVATFNLLEKLISIDSGSFI